MSIFLKEKQEEKYLLRPKLDVVFRALFREENKNLTEAFISDIIGQDIKIKTTDLNRHLDIKIAEQKLGIMDLRTEFEKEKYYKIVCSNCVLLTKLFIGVKIVYTQSACKIIIF